MVLAILRGLVSHVGVNIGVGEAWLTQLLVRFHHVILVQHSWAIAVVATGLPLDLVEAIILQSSLRVTIL